MNESLHLSEENQKIFNEIVSRYKNEFDFFAFGSRVKGTHKKYSDLDLAVIDKNNIGLTKLKNDFDDSNLSITVDLVDLNLVAPNFKNLIEKESIKL